MFNKAYKRFIILVILSVFATGKSYSQADTGLGKNHFVHRNLPPLPLVPEFPGGKDSLAAFIKKHTRYPDSARKHNVTGTVEIDFTVKKDGRLTNIHVYKGIGYGCDKEAVRVVKRMPHWIPSKAGKDTIEIDYHVNIPFNEPEKK